ncbi:MAG TPA: hypothetical protein VMZ31_05110 [Phycisphaerae bacterium]|nr:hypothetical protein [Phycisphaerae bacterium]
MGHREKLTREQDVALHMGGDEHTRARAKVKAAFSRRVRRQHKQRGADGEYD